MPTELLAFNITTPAVVGFASLIGTAFLVAICLPLSKSTAVRAVVALAAGAVMGIFVVWLIIDVFNVFGISFPRTVVAWLAALLGSVALALSSFRRSPRWRKIVAATSLPIFAIVAGVGINAEIGLNRTIGSLLGISTVKDIELVKPDPANSPESAGPLWKYWTPPTDMPATGLQGKKAIPAPVSGFVARDAGIYLPPAARVANPPKLPFVLMLMGQPGNPDPTDIARALDQHAAANRGLAPIVIVADQIGPHQDDTLCVNSSRYGNVETYIMKDILGFAKDNLNILRDSKSWTIAGYSNGGQCAISLGAKYPEIFGNILDISGEEFPGAGNTKESLTNIFHNDRKSYDAEKPVNILKRKAPYSDIAAIFTVGADDHSFKPAAVAIHRAATMAGMTTTYYEVPHAGHLADALTGGLHKGFEVLYPRLGLRQ